MIIDDVVECVNNGRNPIILTERTAHVRILSEELKKHFSDVITLTVAMSDREQKEEKKRLETMPREKSIVIVATGKFVGEGFDEPRLYTLFLAMPISWKGTLQQYSGRLHRLYENKCEVQVYDYVDIHVALLERMYQKRLKGYAGIGYWIKSDIKSMNTVNLIYNSKDFLTVYCNDVLCSKKELVISSPFISKVTLSKILRDYKLLLNRGVKIKIITRPPQDFKENSRKNIKDIHDSLINQRICLILKSEVYKKFAVIDERIVWYGNINLLSFGGSEESIMRIENIEVANELLKDCREKLKEIGIQQGLF